MRILWLVNILMPELAAAVGLPAPYAGGWLTGQLQRLDAERNHIAICCVRPETAALLVREVNGHTHYVLPRDGDWAENFREILRTERPDVIHIHGTEMESSLALMRLAPPERTVVSIQGLVSVCAAHYLAGLPERFAKAGFFKRLLGKRLDIRPIAVAREDFARRGRSEIALLQSARHVIGRTRWDEACTGQINPARHYHFCNETLRPAFYRAPQWRYAECEPHTVLISQGNYPIKGLHQMLEALPLLLKRYPDLQVCVAGWTRLGLPPQTAGGGWKQRLRQPLETWLFEYDTYLRRQIGRLGLEGHVRFLGPLDEAAMCAAYRRANVFVSCSSVENSSNSICEAMLLGLPVVSSYVGGCGDLFTDGQEGLFYPFDAPYLLADALARLFDDPQRAERMGQSARERALLRHDPERNTARLMEIYEQIVSAAEAEKE